MSSAHVEEVFCQLCGKCFRDPHNTATIEIETMQARIRSSAIVVKGGVSAARSVGTANPV